MLFFAQLTLDLPILLVLAGIMMIFLKLPDSVSRWFGYATVIGSAALLVVSVLMALTSPGLYPSPFSWLFGIQIHLDSLSVFFVLLINVVMFAASWNALSYLEGRAAGSFLQKPTVFHTLINFFHFTMLLVPMLDNMVGVWIAIELTTLGSAFLVAFHGRRSSWEAAWKYLIITSTGITLALLGTVFLANAIPKERISSIAVLDWTSLLNLAKHGELQKDFVWLAFLFGLVGYGTKAGLAPMHTWLPDGHGEAPSPISALLSGVLLKAALYAILRFYTLTNLVLGDTRQTSTAILVISLLSLMVATPFILKTNRFKRVLAYHSLEHMGIITFGLALGGPIAIFGALLHSLNHAITKALMFLAFGNVIKQYNERGVQEPEITGVLKSMPLTGGILSLGGLALVGAPPFNIFMSEFIILWGAFSKFWATSEFSPWVIGLAIFVFVFSTTLIFFGLVRHLGKIVLNPSPRLECIEKFDGAKTVPLVFLATLMLALGVWVFPILANLINESIKVILGLT
ncbi:MAG: proton-conducting transporter membrane subunit [Chloroflexota bacterium]